MGLLLFHQHRGISIKPKLSPQLERFLRWIVHLQYIRVLPVFDPEHRMTIGLVHRTAGDDIHVVGLESGLFDPFRDRSQRKLLARMRGDRYPVFLQINPYVVHAIQACEGVFDALRSGQSLHAFRENIDPFESRCSLGR